VIYRLQIRNYYIKFIKLKEIELVEDECGSENDDYEDDEEQDAILNAIEREIEDAEVIDNYY
jgi:hypothetical protein